MPLQKLQFRPGVSREQTTLAGEGGWFDADKVRFRSGLPEKIGGWINDGGPDASTLQPPTGSFWGVCRSLWNWLNLSNYNLLGVGTNLKFYIQNSIGGAFNDITPIRETTTAGEPTFAAINGSPILTVTDNGHGAQANDFVTFSGAVTLGGTIIAAVLNAEFQVTSIISNNVYTITAAVNANAADVGNGGASVVAAYQLTTGSATYTQGVGWGAGGWGVFGWGSPATTGIGLQLRLWSQANFGENLIINPRGGALYLWDVNASPNIYDRAVIISATDAPSICNYVTVSDASRFVLAFGVNDYSSVVQDPLLIRWSDQESTTQWTPAITNQAGSYRLSRGSQIIAAVQARQEVLVFTDAAIYSMQYQGPPFVWGFQLLADNISLISPNAIATANNIAYWMGTDKFYAYSGRVETLPSSLRQYVFGDINIAQSYQAFASTNEGYNEIWWFYCSSTSSSVDRYVVFNHLDKVWYYGTLARTAWLDSPLRSSPTAAGYNGQIIYHETGTDDGTTNPPSPITAYVQSSDFDIGDGHNYGFVDRIIPDVTFNGSSALAPTLDFTVRPRQNPGANYNSSQDPSVVSAQSYLNQRTYNVQQFTQNVYVRVRGRQMAFRVESSTLGTAWQLGAPRISIRPDGRR